MKKVHFLIFFLMINRIAFSQSEDSTFTQAVHYLSENKYHEADSIFTICLSKYPNNSFYYFSSLYNRGLSRMYSGNLDAALKDFESCVKINDKNYNVYQALGECYLYKEDYINSLKYVDYALYLKPSELDVYIVGAKSAYSIVELEQGIEYCTKALKNKKDARFYAIRSMLYLANGNEANSKKDIDTGVKLFGEHEINMLEARVYYAYSFDQKSDFEKYLKDLKSQNSNYPFFMSLESDFIEATK